MEQARKTIVEAEAFAAQAHRRAADLLVSTRLRGESVHDEGDFIARAVDQIYLDERRATRAGVRRRGHT